MMLRSLLPVFGTIFLAFLTFSIAKIALGPTPPSETLSSEAPASVQPAVQKTVPSTIFSRTPPPDSFYEVILERPLFAPSRRPVKIAAVQEEAEPLDEEPFDEEPVEVLEATIEPLDFVLSGVLESGGERSAFLRQDGEAGSWFRVGETAGSWSVDAIGADWVELSAGEQTFRLELFQ